MSAPVLPRIYIDPPTLEPYRYGLFGAAQPISPDDDHWQIGGAEWESLASYEAMQYLAGILAGGEDAETKTLPDGLGTTAAWPFAVYAGVDCGSVGYTPDEVKQRALRILDLAAQHAAEAALWVGAGDNTVALTGENADASAPLATVLNGGDPFDNVAAGVGALEQWIADHYNGRAMLHAPRNVAAYADVQRQVHRDKDTDTLNSTLGTRWVFGGGYDPTIGPGGDATPDGASWIFVTGQVIIARSAPIVPASFGEALNRLLNREFLIAEQLYMLGIDGPWAAALVTNPT